MSGPPVPKVTADAEDAGPTGPKATTERMAVPGRPPRSQPRGFDKLNHRRSVLLGALVEREFDYFERLCLTAEVDVQCRTGGGVFDVDIRHGHRVAEGG